MNAFRIPALTSLCFALLASGATPLSARTGHQAAESGDDNGLHLGWENKPNHVAITKQPLGVTVVAGRGASFTVEAEGKPTKLTYRWKKDGVPVGKDAPILELPVVTPELAGSYTVTVSNPTGSVTSVPAVLTVNVPPVITREPASLTVVKGGVATFTVAATGSGTLGYQWRKAGAPLAGATSPELRLPAVTAADAGAFDVVVTNTLNDTTTITPSRIATLTVHVPPVIATSPASQTITQGRAVTFTVAATSPSGGILTYQWRKDQQPLSGATSATFTIEAVAGPDAGAYDAVITSTLNGTVTAATSDAGTLTVHTPPSITLQPQTCTVAPPDAVTFTVAAVSNHGGALSYAWKKNGTAIPAATGTTYTVPYTEFATNADSYTVTVHDGTFTTESQQASAVASVASPVYAGDPVTMPSRPVTVLNSFHLDAVAFPNGAFRLGYDEALKNPVWTAYVNFPVRNPYPNSKGDYTRDPRLAAPQVGKEDYTGIYTGGASSPTSYDRGHMVPRADISYRYTPVAGDDATMMSNLVPQISQFNQQTWQRLEEAIGGNGGGASDGLTATKGRIWVYTGSVFPADSAWWASRVTPGLNIAIPTACYKIVVSETTPGEPKALAVLMPNVWGLVNADSTLTPYVTSVARVEALTGLDFFPSLSSVAPGLNIPTWKATVDVRGWKAPFEQATGPNVHMIQPSFDQKIDAGTPVAFEGAATPNGMAAGGTTLATATWNFGDGTPTTTGLRTSHVYTSGGTYQASFTVQDSLGASNSITRVITVKGANEAPTLSGLADVSTPPGTPVTVSFTAKDDATLAGDLILTASTENPDLLPGTLVVVNAGGTCSLQLLPAAGKTGTAKVTVTVKDAQGASSFKTFTLAVQAAVTALTEGFDAASKSGYAVGDVVLPTGTWTLNDALLGSSAGQDRWNGTKSVRLRNGSITPKFDFAKGARTVTIQHAKFSSDAGGAWGLWYTTDAGATWIQAGAAVVSSTTTLSPAVFEVNVAKPVRFEIRKTDNNGSRRVSLDDFQVVSY